MRYGTAKHAMICKTYVISNPYRLSNRFLAAVFLLSRNMETWKRAKKAIIDDRIDFKRIPNIGLDPYQYSIVCAAQDIYEDTRHITLYDIGDAYLMEGDLFDLIINALLICKKGYDGIGVKKKYM